ncbi:MAG: hypothetical protein CMH54_03440 [Myxococcales bacterium]|nr:hypothetical protein [Myxococcales bacterium]|tara:strand:- start:1346 stop:1873 length:528 start_codon:yes stop_codon:yes gene_type:complete
MSATTTYRFVAIVDGKELPIQVEVGAGSQVRYRIGPNEGVADVHPAQDGTAYLMSRGNKQLALRVARTGDNFDIMARDYQLGCRLVPESRYLMDQLRGGGSGGEGIVRAHMPGRIIAVSVAPGDTVTADQGVVVLEAMKMENEIKAGLTGVVKSVHVETGDAVESGALLLEISDA